MSSSRRPQVWLERQSASELYTDLLQTIVRTGTLVDLPMAKSSPSHGKNMIELMGPIICLTKVQHRLAWAPARPLNLGFCFGNFFGVLLAWDDVERWDYYNPNTPRFSDNGKTLHGAYGPRIRQQISDVIYMLRNDPGTRRAVITFFDGSIDHRESKDIPCPIDMQFFVRDGVVECYTKFRSQNYLMVFPYDIFLFTMLHEWIAVHAGYPAGAHIQWTTSQHIYEEEKLLAESVMGEYGIDVKMRPMSPLKQEQHAILVQHERNYREYGLKQRGDMLDIPHGRIPDFWCRVLFVLREFAETRHKGERQLRNLAIMENAWA